MKIQLEDKSLYKFFNQTKLSQDKVTIALFSKEDANGEYSQKAFEEAENIKEIAKKLKASAEKLGRTVPEVMISVLLIPNWNKTENSYENETYLQAKEKFIAQSKLVFSDAKLNIAVEDFYLEGGLTDGEINYLNQLDSLGSTIDMIKTRAIINNKDVRHLQLDSNIKIYDYDAFYAQTFASGNQQDALNACCYTDYYVAAHNKIVYTTPEGKIAAALELPYIDYCEAHQNNSVEKKPGRKSFIYNHVFAATLFDLELVHQKISPNSGSFYYPANLENDQYRITENIVSAINKSWSTENTSCEDLIKTLSKQVIRMGMPSATCKLFCI